MRAFLLLLLQLLLNGGLYAQTSWVYNFNEASETADYSPANDFSESFLPAPATGGGTARVRVGTGGGGFSLVSPGSSVGTDYELQGIAPDNGSVNKFSVYGYSGSELARLAFKVKLEGGDSGVWFFYAGNGSGFSNNLGSSTSSFVGLRFTFDSSNSIKTERRTGSGAWSESGTSGIIKQGDDYLLEIYANNSNNSVTYNYADYDYTIDAGEWHLWLNGDLVNPNGWPKAELEDNIAINSFMFYGESSINNAATIYLDDIAYSSEFLSTLPVSLIQFNAQPMQKDILINWNTISEKNSSHFNLLHSADGENFSLIHTQAAAGNSDQIQHYSFLDQNPFEGSNYYKLVQYDLDGKSLSKIIEAKNNADENKLIAYAEGNGVKCQITVEISRLASLLLYSVGGAKLAEMEVNLQKGANFIKLDKVLQPGIYFVQLQSGGESSSAKFIKN